MNLTALPPSLAASPRITIAGFGEVGQAFAKALQAQGLHPRLYHPAPRESARRQAAALGLPLHVSAAEAFTDCDLVLNVAPGTQALSVAGAAAPHLKATGSLFADLSSGAPADLRAAAGLFGAAGYVDVAIMGAVSIHGHRTPLLASGPFAAALVDRMVPLGFAVDVLPDSQPGDATALKLVRSVLTKGMDGVVTECLLVAEALGLRHTLLANIGDLDRSTLSELIAMFIRTHAPHAQRRLHEVEAVEDTLQNLGLKLIITPAVRERYQRTVQLLGPNAQLPEGAVGEAMYDKVLPWMLQAELADGATKTPHTTKETP